MRTSRLDWEKKKSKNRAKENGSLLSLMGCFRLDALPETWGQSWRSQPPYSWVISAGHLVECRHLGGESQVYICLVHLKLLVLLPPEERSVNIRNHLYI